ncbi:MAG: alanine/ornithine racemase family PLP-dependent enzyme [Firmicutes bacterium]|nr:alanine/ornithine racemase family PLP-dependent enzyme [Bacillota bacterium]
MYPRVVIDKKKFRHNLKYLIDLCHNRGMSVMGVSKVYCGDLQLVEIMIDEEVDFIADSRIENLKGFSSVIPKVLLRLPSISLAEEVVKHSDISLNSEIETVRVLNKFARELDKIHKVILMIDLGDLREGIFEKQEVFDIVEDILKLEHIKLFGIGVNLTCYGGVIPTHDKLMELVDYKTQIEQKFNIKLEIVSGGNSSNLELVLEDRIPFGINNIRLGEGIVLGRETAYGDYLEDMYLDVFTLEAEIIELKEKPSIPIGEIGMNAFGKVPTFTDRGTRLRAILAIGKQDVDYKELVPIDTIHLLGSSSDHLIVDVSDSNVIYEVGDIIKFRLTYASILSLMTSKYVGKYYE